MVGFLQISPSLKQPLLALVFCTAGTAAWAHQIQCKYEVESVEITDVSCYGGNDGAIDIDIHGVNGSPITIKWLNIPGQVYSTNPQNLTASTYYLRVVDSAGCVDTLEFIVNEPPPLVAIPNNITVCTGTTARLFQVVAGGVPGYTYQWASTDGYACFGCSNDEVVITQPVQFTVTISDSNGCTLNHTVTFGAHPAVQLSTQTVAEVCGLDGEIVAQPSGGTPPFMFSLNGGAFQQQPAFEELESGQYLIEVEDSKACSKQKTASIADQTTNVAMQVFTDRVSCANAQDGEIFIQANAGTVNWYGVDGIQQTFPWFSNLSGGLHQTFVQDTNGCIIEQAITIYEPVAPTMHLQGIDLTCFGSGDGIVLASTSGGSYPVMEYSIAGNTSSTGHFSQLSAGTHVVFCTDSSGCTYSSSVTLSEPSQIVLDSVHVSPASCNGLDDAGFTAFASGGAGVFMYSIDGANFQPSAAFSNLLAGTYYLTVRDSSGCESIETITVTEPPGVQVSTWIGDATCNAEKDGEIIVITSGGAVVSHYALDGGPWQLSNTFSGLGASLYEVHVRDTLGCVYSAYAEIHEPDPIDITGAVTISGGSADIDVSAAGGHGDFSYLWSTGDTTEDLTGVPNGVYIVYVTDKMGCVDSAFFVVAGTAVPGLNDEDKVFIYPNPASEWLHVSFILSSMRQVTLEIHDMLGQSVAGSPGQLIQKSDVRFDVQALASGIYTLRLTMDGHAYVTKFIKG